MTVRLPPPGPSAVPELTVASNTGPCRAGIGQPSVLTDDWWVTLLWVADDDGLVPVRVLASSAGPPADPPLARLGPALAGNLSGMVLEEGGRQMLRLRLGVAPEDDRLPWEAPLVVVAGFRWEPMRAATMPDAELASVVLAAFARSLDALGRP